MPVQQGQILAYIAPLLGGEADIAGLELDLKRAEYSFDLAREQRRRLEGLLEKGAVAKRRVLEARNAEAIARAELQAAEKRLAQVTRAPAADTTGVAVRAPISGTIAYVTVAPGGYVEQGDRLFHVLDARRLWLDARIAEADLGRIRQPTGAWFTAEGFEHSFEITPGEDVRLVAFGGMVDPVNRTVPAVFEFANPGGRLRVGLFVTARVYTGEEREDLAVPAGAIVNDAGTEVVYVQLGGERFERRVVQTGLRDRDYVIVTDGLSPHERVVSRGAYLLHLAAGAPAEVGHGHAH
jgi:RND family efflux transporter MFP subunit